MTALISIVAPATNFALLIAVGLDLTPDDFARVRRQRAVVLTGLFAPLVLLPPIALWLTSAFHASPDLAGAMLLIAACPIGGVSNAWSYLARASPALSVTLTGLSCLFASITIPLIGRGVELAVGRPLELVVPIPMLVGQLTLMLAVPVGLGMWLRRRSPDRVAGYRPALQQIAFIGIGLLFVLVIVGDIGAFVGGLATMVPLAALFVLMSFAAGWLTAMLVTKDHRDRFTVAAEFGTRNIGVALAIAVTLLGRVEFARFATTYALTEVPIMLGAVVLFRRYVAKLEARGKVSRVVAPAVRVHERKPANRPSGAVRAERSELATSKSERT